MMNQQDRDILRRASEFIVQFNNNGSLDESCENSIEEVHAFCKERDLFPTSVVLYGDDGSFLGNYPGENFMKIDVNDLDKDNYIEKSRKVNKIVSSFYDLGGDVRIIEYDSIEAASAGVAEMISDADSSSWLVDSIKGYVGDEHVCNYTAKLIAKLNVQPAV